MERSTEGLHSIVKRSLARAPSARISYLSLELRFPQLMMMAISQPRVFQTVSEGYASLSKHAGFKEAVLKLGQLSKKSWVGGWWW